MPDLTEEQQRILEALKARGAVTKGELTTVLREAGMTPEQQERYASYRALSPEPPGTTERAKVEQAYSRERGKIDPVVRFATARTAAVSVATRLGFADEHYPLQLMKYRKALQLRSGGFAKWPYGKLHPAVMDALIENPQWTLKPPPPDNWIIDSFGPITGGKMGRPGYYNNEYFQRARSAFADLMEPEGFPRWVSLRIWHNWVDTHKHYFRSYHCVAATWNLMKQALLKNLDEGKNLRDAIVATFKRLELAQEAVWRRQNKLKGVLFGLMTGGIAAAVSGITKQQPSEPPPPEKPSEPIPEPPPKAAPPTTGEKLSKLALPAGLAALAAKVLLFS